MLRHGTLGVVLVGFAALGFSAGGCGGGDDDDDGGGRNGDGTAAPFDSGVSGSKAVTELSADEAQRLCAEYSEYVSARFTPELMKGYACNLQAGLAAQSDAECGAKVDECLQSASGEGPGEVEPTVNCELDDAARSGCSATVGEIEACFVAAIDQAVSAFGMMTCEAIRSGLQSGSGPPAEPPALPEACQVLMQKCPSFITEGDAAE